MVLEPEKCKKSDRFFKLDENVNVAIGAGGALENRAEQRQPADAMAAAQRRQGFLVYIETHRITATNDGLF